MTTTVALILAAILAVAAVLYVARPFLREPEAPNDGLVRPDGRQLEHLRLVEERDRALTALKELEFDHRTGKISDEDYERSVGSLRVEAAAALKALDGTATGTPRSE